MTNISPNYDFISYFKEPDSASHKQYLALRRFFLDGRSAEQVAREFGYAIGTVYSLVRDFKRSIHSGSEDPFFKTAKPGRKPVDTEGEVENSIIGFRKQYLSVPDIKVAMDGLGYDVSESYIYSVIHKAGFARLPRRSKGFKNDITSSITKTIPAPIAKHLRLNHQSNELFSSQSAGLLCMMPYIVKYGIHKIIDESAYPQTKDISRLSAILSFVALKLSNVKRYSADDTWCMDRGMGLFAGLNVLPKAAWFSSYSSSITRDTNLSFLRQLQHVWQDNGLLSDTVNLDFTTIPYWGDDDHLENNWSGKRGKALSAICAVIAQDPHHGIICYGDTTIRHENQNDTVLEFLDFYHPDKSTDAHLKYLVFDSRFTSYGNLNKLNESGIKFITIRRRGKNLQDHIHAIADERWSKVKVQKANGKNRTVTVFEEITTLKDYTGSVRQVFIKDNGKIKPAIIITNEFDLTLAALLQKYARRWLVEKEISEQIDFFHLNRNSSGIVVKVDFDLTMTILSHNLYRLFALDFPGYSHCEAQTIFDKFLSIHGSVDISPAKILVRLKKKRSLPLILEQMALFKDTVYPWLSGWGIDFLADSST